MSTLVELLRSRAAQQPELRLYTYLNEGVSEGPHFTCAQLDERARAIGALLQQASAKGARALLLYPQGLEFIAAFFGCLYSGVIAIPAPLLDAARLERMMGRLQAIVKDGSPLFGLTTSANLPLLEESFERLEDLRSIRWLATDEVDIRLAQDWTESQARSDSLAYLQYTSGSTSVPKGVMVSHGNVLHNSISIRDAWGYDADSVSVVWVPQFHDDGLVHGVIQPLATGFQSFIMPPFALVQHPANWLRAVTTHRATHTGGPNFAYALCTRKVTPTESATLDLSSWRVAYNAAEPIRQETIEKFVEKFAPQGFRAEAFYPAYGLAEATLLVTSRRPMSLPEFLSVEVEPLEQTGRIVDGRVDGPRSRTLVGCGNAVRGVDVAIVNPESLTRCPDNQVGEVWIRSASVAQGYWNRPEETELTFGVHLADTGEGPFLLTGDLGFIRDKELFITGRLKDLIIVDGSNHYPQDIEWTVEQSHSAIRRGCTAAFAMEENGVEQLVIAAEVDAKTVVKDYDEIARSIWQAVAEQNQLEIHVLALLKPGSIPKTSSGKIQRHVCRINFGEGNLNIVAQWKQQSLSTVAQTIESDSKADESVASKQAESREHSQTHETISTWLLAHLSARLGIKPEEMNVQEPFARYGLVSSAAVSMLGDLASWLGRRLSPTLIWEYPNINALAGYLAKEDGVQQRESEGAGPGQSESSSIAIIGIGCRFPQADSTQTFWNLLREGVDAISEVPPERWNLRDFYDPNPSIPGKMNTRWGGFVKNVADFDAEFFGISPREAARIDPQQRLLLEVAWEALEDGGLVPAQLAGTQCGVFIGISTNDYGHLQSSDPRLVDAYLGTGNALSISANRLSYFLDLSGPSIAVDTACSSSLVAVHLACQSLRSGESKLALAGGVNLILSPFSTISFTKAGAMSPDGRCKAFDAGANGYVRSEGAGVVVLKPLSRALADGNSIYAVIRGSAINNDGRTNGLMAPSPHAQQAVLRTAYDRSGIAPAQVQYLEAHGSGTFLGDPIEAGALGGVLSEGRSSEQPCAIGSVKSNIGHLEAAAGIAGLIKVALALQHREIPPSVHFKQPNPHIPFSELKLRVQTELAPWPAENGHAYAGVSSFGFGGTNAHVVLEAAPSVPSNQEDTASQIRDRAYLLPLSAHSPEALRASARAYIEFIGTMPADTLPDLCYSTSLSRTHHEHRLSLVGRTTEELVEQLKAFLEGERRAGMYTGHSQPGRKRKLVFVFPGQGSQWRGMGQQLWEQEPVFRASIERTGRALSRHVKWSLVESFTTENFEHPQFDEIDFIQPMLFALQVGLAELWRSWNIAPNAVVGQSMGEVAAAHVAGALSLEDAVCIISERSLLLKEKRGLGQMMSVDLSLQNAQRLLEGYEDRVSVAVSSGPTSTVLSGEPTALNELMERLQADDIFCAMVKVDVASHSSQMDSLREPLLQVLVNLSPNVPAIPLYSTVLGGLATGTLLDALYWWRNLREPVLFSTTIQNLLTDEHDLFLEISAHPVVSAGIHQVLQHANREGDVLPSLRREEAERSVLLGSLGGLSSHGVDVDWSALYTARRRLIKLPSYPWQRERCWLETESPENLFTSPAPPLMRSNLNRHPLLGTKPITPDAAGNYSWEIELNEQSLSYLLDHQVLGRTIFPATAYIEMAVAATGQLFGNEFVELTKVEFREVLLITPDEPRRIRFVLSRQAGDASAFQVYSKTQVHSGNQSWTLHAAGQIQCGRSSDVRGLPEPIIPQEVIKECGEEIGGSDFYLELKTRGYEYGVSFQGIKRIWRRDGEALGQVEAPAEVTAEGGYKLHPAILDACLQLSAATLPSESSKIVEEVPYLPVSINQVRFSEYAGTPVWGHARLRTGHENQQDDYESDVRLLDEERRVIVEVLGLRLRKYLRGAAARSTEIPGDWFYQVQWLQRPRPVQLQNSVKGSWLIFVDSIGVGQSVSAQLEEQGETCVTVTCGSTFEAVSPNSFRVDPCSPDDSQQLLDAYLKVQTSPCRGVVHLWGLDVDPAEGTTIQSLEEAQVLTCGSVLSLVQAMAQTDMPNARLWLVTRGTQDVNSENLPISVAASTLWGFGRSIAHEYPELRCTNVDLGYGEVTAEARSLFEELLNSDEETQVALRGNKRLRARLARLETGLTTAKSDQTKRRFNEAQDESFRLELTEPGTCENLELHATPRVAPAVGEVEIQIHAAGLNFVDVLKALGMGPVLRDGPMLLGGECAGTITAIGKGVVFHHVGEEVIAIAPACFGKYTTTDAALVLRKPSNLTFEEAATIPVAFVTAYYALHRLGRLRAGERVLIHAGSGGVGLAAVQLAQLAGAEIYATAGSEEKREFLRSLKVHHVMDSRTTAFAEKVLELTGGEGVDLILNSLSGEAIAKGISILRPYGRFLEIGKHDIQQNSHLQLKPFQNNLSFFAIDIERMYRERPELVGAIMCEVVEHFERHELRPLPSSIFPIAEVESGFRLMGQAKHIGKIVISLQDPDVSIVDTSGVPSRFKTDCTYLIAGGLGGLGLAVAQWMVSLGAKHLVLLGRHDPTPAARDIIVELQTTGAQIEVFKTDITRTEQVSAVVARIRESMPPLKGVIHAAGVLDDGLLLRMSQETLWSVMGPKIYGGWNLHTCTLDSELDFFLLFSSAASIFGPAGQANYAAGNAFLDALAYHRRALRLPCLSINWGRWADIGLAAEKGRGSYLDRQGFGLISPERGLDALGLALDLEKVAKALIAPINWKQFGANGQFTPLVEQLVDEEAAANPQTARSVGPELAPLTRAALLSVDPEDRLSILHDYLREQVARVLGISAARLDATKPLNKMGLDSVMAVELKYRLERLGVVIPVVKFLKDASINSLSRLVSAGLDDLEARARAIPQQPALQTYQLTKTYQVLPTAPDSPQLLAAIERLSENDLDSLLDTLLAEQA